MKAKIKVTLKKDILDPQGKAVLHSINDLKYSDVHNVRIGKYIEIDFKAQTRSIIEQEADEICKKLLANPIIENYEFKIEED